MQKISLPACENCHFFIPGKYNRTGLCSKLILDKPRGKLIYEWADSARFYENKCGKDGKYFKPLELQQVQEDPKDYLENFKDLFN
jgi:hypothetical protein